MLKKKIVLILKRNDVVKAGLFGSYARGDQKKRSDIDILIKFDGRRRKSLIDLVRLKDELQDEIHRKVDVVTYRSLHPLLKKNVLQEEVRLL